MKRVRFVGYSTLRGQFARGQNLKLQREGRRGALCASLKRKFLSAHFTRQLTLPSPDLAKSTTADLAKSTTADLAKSTTADLAKSTAQ
jgi:hypothetical protein